MNKALLDTPYIPRNGVNGLVHRRLTRYMGVTPLMVTPAFPIITFSFDDVPKSAVDYGAQALEDRGWRGVFFAACGLAGVNNHHGEQFVPADLVDLDSRGHEIGCHSFSHADASRLPPEAMAEDTARNRDFLRQAGLRSIPSSFAFPYGEARPATKKQLLNHYRALRGVQPGINRGKTDRGLLKAIALDGGSTGLKTALKAVETVCENPGWLIFYGHDIRPAPSQWGCTPDFFNTVLDAVQHASETSGAVVLTQSAALDLIEEGQVS